MAFRDDHEALRTRIEALEEELGAATAALDAFRSGPKKSAVGPDVARWIFIALGLVAGAIALYLGYGLSGYVGERAGIGVLAVGIILVLLGVVIGQLEISSPDEALILVGRSSSLPD